MELKLDFLIKQTGLKLFYNSCHKDSVPLGFMEFIHFHASLLFKCIAGKVKFQLTSIFTMDCKTIKEFVHNPGDIACPMLMRDISWKLQYLGLVLWLWEAF